MAVYSMTGFASASAQGTAADASAPLATAVTVEARSVNSRFLDVALRLPDELRHLEPALRETLSGALRRGKVELRVACTSTAADDLAPPAAAQLGRLRRIENLIKEQMPDAAPLSVHEVLHWSRGSAPPTAVPDDTVLRAAQACITALKQAREREGARLAQVLTDRTADLRKLAARAAPLVPAVVQRQQQRFVERWEEALQAAGGTNAAAVPAEAARERALNEAAAYALRIDVAEELSRLAVHLDEIDRLLATGGDVGKRLDFLIQELHREANTLGSKSAALELTGISVDMRVLIEQMREQVQNIE